MAICFPCGHTVDEKEAPSWTYKDTTFYFCSLDCEEEVKAEPMKWLAVSKMPAAEQKRHAHGHGHHEPAPSHDSHDHGPGGHSHH